MSIALVDNEISQAALEFSTVLSLLKRLEATMEEANNAILQQNNDISKSEAEIGRNNALIERKQTQIDQMNKKIELKLSKVGGVSVTIASDVHALICTCVLVQEHVQYACTRNSTCTYMYLWGLLYICTRGCHTLHVHASFTHKHVVHASSDYPPPLHVQTCTFVCCQCFC